MEINKQLRTLCIGDIHGGLKGLLQCLEQAEYNKEYDKLIFLGDYVDGWSESAELIDFLLDIQAQAKYPPIFIRGNHDKWCEDWLLYGQINKHWLPQGGQSTVESYIDTKYIVDERNKNFFKNLVNYYIDDENRGFVHGGFISKKGLGHDAHESDYYWDRNMFELAILRHNSGLVRGEGSPIGRRMYKHKEVFIGHTSVNSYRIKESTGRIAFAKKKVGLTTPLKVCNVWNLDTGAGWSGKLTIMDIDSKQYWQSDFVKELYPAEKGR